MPLGSWRVMLCPECSHSLSGLRYEVLDVRRIDHEIGHKAVI